MNAFSKDRDHLCNHTLSTVGGVLVACDAV
jgi:hypothetical protein